MAKWGLFSRKNKPETSPQEDAGQHPERATRSSQGHPVGELLRSTREEMDVTLEKVEEATRIRAKYLLALEESRYDDMPTPGHIRGFLHNYARYLGLDVQEVEELYTRARSSHRLFEPKIFHPKNIELVPKQSLIKADLVLFIVVVMVLAVAGWAFWQYGLPMLRPGPTATPTATATLVPAVAKASVTPTRGSTRPTETPAPPTATASVEPTLPAPTPTATIDAPLTIVTPTQVPIETPTPTLTLTPTEGVLIQVKVIDRVWLQIAVDGQELPGELLEVGEEKEWQAQYTVYMVCGNAGGIEVTVNGEQMGVLGERAEVVERIWGPQGELTPTPDTEEVAAVTPTATQAP